MAALALAALLLAAIYLPALRAPLVWDDKPTIVLNPALRQPQPWSRYVSAGYYSFSGEATWRPWMTLATRGLVSAFGPSPLALRGAGLILHLVNAWLLVVFLKRFGVGPPWRSIAAALFLVHPAHVETLMCVSFGEELWVGLGILLMLSSHCGGAPVWAAAGFCVAMLSKETGMLGLPLAVLCDALGNGAPPPLRRRLYAVYGALLGGYAWLRFVSLADPLHRALGLPLPLTERLYHACQSLVIAGRTLLCPVRLAIEYPAVPPATAWEGAAWVLAGLAMLGALAWAAARLRGLRRPDLLFLAWPLVFLAATANILSADVLGLRTMAERWLYLPALGVCVLLARAVGTRPVAWAMLLGAWASLTSARVQDWKDEPRLWRAQVERVPWSASARESLGKAYLSAGRDDEALAAFEKALAIRETRQDRFIRRYAPLTPEGTLGWESASLYDCVGLILLRRRDPAGAEAMFIKAVGARPTNLFALRMLAYIAARSGKPRRAKEWLAKGLALYPGDGFLLRLRSDLDRGIAIPEATLNYPG